MQSYASENRKAMAARVSATQGKGGVLGFFLLALISVGVCALAAFASNGPVTSPYFDDWMAWARIETLASGVMLLFFFCALIGIIGMFVRLFSPRPAQTLPATRVMSASLKPASSKTPASKPSRLTLDDTAPMVASPAMAEAADSAPEDLSIPATKTETRDDDQTFTRPKSATVQPLRPDLSRRGALKFDAATFGASESQTVTATAEPEPAEPVIEAKAAEPVVEAIAQTAHVVETSLADTPAEDTSTPEAAPVDVQRHSAEIITLRPQVVAQTATAAASEAEHTSATDALAQEASPLVDPIATALLADAPEPTTGAVAESDINAVISSAMRFIDSPAPQVEVTHEALHRAMTEDDATLTPAFRISESHVPEPSNWTVTSRDETRTDIAPSTETLIKASATVATTDAETRVSGAVDKALGLWPQTTRSIAADELKVRAGYLYSHPAPEVRNVFDLMAEGNVDLAASCLQTLANARAFGGQPLEAAELWRAFGALHMGRDDPRAMMAYEQVSALDPSDANIHLYLSRRYAMEGKTDLMLPVLSRALMTINDPYTRIELLGHYGDLALKAGMLNASSQAFGELSQLQEIQGQQNPDNLQMRSAHAISVAKLAQVRELQGQTPMAAPLYMKAYKLLADLSARVPDHAGLRAMTANALKDATRLNAG